MYGYDPLHNQDEISMFLALSSKLDFGQKICKHENQNPNMYFVTKKKSFLN